jgi:hypothetical protein
MFIEKFIFNSKVVHFCHGRTCEPNGAAAESGTLSHNLPSGRSRDMMLHRMDIGSILQAKMRSIPANQETIGQ